MTDKKETSVKKPSILKNIVEWILYLAFVALACYFIINFVGQRTEVQGESMEPSLQNGDNLIVDKISYRFKEPKRYDVIVFPYSQQDKVFYIKRIIGLPGETIQIIDGYVYIDGKLLEDEKYGKEVMNDPGIAENAITLSSEEYFVLGDNRNHSRDSRSPSVGVLTYDDLIGKAWIRIYPFDKIGVVSHE